ncbi:hypothetical protein HRG_014505 [Hirsutella rhossiliensis]
MASRIVVKCYSQRIPGEPRYRDKEIAKIICKHEWGRNQDDRYDTFHSSGQFAVDGNRCYFLLDTGPTHSQDVKVQVYRWDGNQLQTRPVSPAVLAYLRNIPFRSRQPAGVGLSDEEYLARRGKEAFDNVMRQRIEQKRRWGWKLLPSETKYLADNPGFD